MRMRLRETGSFIKRHRLLVGSGVAIIAVWGAGLVWYSTSSYQQISKLDSITEQKITEAIRLGEKNAERIAREQTAKEVARTEAAKDAANKAKDATATSAYSIDPKTCNPATTHNDPTKINVVVNKKHCIQPLAYAPADLVTTNGATLSSKAAEAYSKLYAAATAAGQNFTVTSSYRSYGSQVATFNRWVATSGLIRADTYSARPGYSEHQTGFAFDVGVGNCKLDCFGSTSQYAWLQKNAADYGFIQRYYKDFDPITGYKAEEWHYRYVGETVAKDMKAKGIKTLEEYWGIPGGNYF